MHAFYYPPLNPGFRAPAGTTPPLLVLSHGGPTGATDAVFDPEVQFWTTRGFAVVDVNYGGSTGYGRAYRQRLNGQWGVVDVRDAVNAAKHLVAAGKADPARLITRGGSAGGYTTLAALTFHDTFKAGASYYGISDLEVLAARHAQVRVALHGLAGRAVSGDAGDLSRALADPPRRPAQLRAHPAAGARRQGGAAEPVAR